MDWFLYDNGLRQGRVKNRLHSSRIILSKFERSEQLLFPLKASGNHWFSDDFRGNRSWLISFSSFNIKNEIWRWSLTLLIVNFICDWYKGSKFILTKVLQDFSGNFSQGKNQSFHCFQQLLWLFFVLFFHSVFRQKVLHCWVPWSPKI